MLRRARERLEATKLRKGKLTLVEGDMTAFDLDQKFGLIFVAANTFQHLLTTAQQRDCLRCVAAHLALGGIFACSIRSPASVTWEEGDGWAPLLLHWARTDPDTGETLIKQCAEQPDPSRMVRRLTYVYDRVQRDGSMKRAVFTADLRYSSQAEMELLLQQQGLHVTHVYGDYDLTPVGQGDNLIFVARAEDRR